MQDNCHNQSNKEALRVQTSAVANVFSSFLLHQPSSLALKLSLIDFMVLQNNLGI